MKKKVFLLILCFLLVPFLFGCKKKAETPPTVNNDNPVAAVLPTEAVTQAPTEAATEAATEDATEPATEPETAAPEAETKSRLTENFFKTIDGGTYHMQMKIHTAEEPSEIVVDSYAKGGKIATVMEIMDMSVRYVFFDGKSHMIMDEYQMVLIETADPNDQMPVITGSSLLTHIGQRSGVFLGKARIFEEYSFENEMIIQYYFDGDELTGMRTINPNGTVTDIEILILETDVPDGIFDIPQDYLFSSEEEGESYSVEIVEQYISGFMGFNMLLFFYDFTNDSYAVLDDIPFVWTAMQGGTELEFSGSEPVENEIARGATVRSGCSFWLENEEDDIVLYAEAEGMETLVFTIKMNELEIMEFDMSMTGPDNYIMLDASLPSMTYITGERDVISTSVDFGDDYEVIHYKYSSETPYDDMLDYASYLINEFGFFVVVGIEDDDPIDEGEIVLIYEYDEEDFVIRVTVEWTASGYEVSAGKIHMDYFR